MSYVIATAGHVDHGKSTLVRALTGIEPDRWAEEKRRGLTIDLGFAWTTLPSGKDVSFVDVPGHERFLGNMLAGLGPAPVVCFVVAADEGWQAQSSDHRDAVNALGIRHGIVTLTRADLAPGRITEVTGQVRAELASTGLADAPIIPVSSTTGEGLEDIRGALDTALTATPPPDPTARVRLWVDRAFSIKGAGTVVTGTLGGGTVRHGDTLTLCGEQESTVTVRGLQAHGAAVDSVAPTARVALNLRGVPADQIHRGQVLVTPGAWPTIAEFDVRRSTGPEFTAVPSQIVLHVGTAAIPARLRPFDGDHARLRIDRPVPVVPGDPLIVRYPTGEVVLGGARVLDVDPQPLNRRGDSAEHTRWLSALPDGGDPIALTRRLSAVPRAHLTGLGLVSPEDHVSAEQDVVETAGWWVHRPALEGWISALQDAVRQTHRSNPLAPGLPVPAASERLGIADPGLMDAVVKGSGLVHRDGVLADPTHVSQLGAAEAGVQALEARWVTDPFDAPEAYDLDDLHLGPKELAAAERVGRLVRLGDGVVVGPRTPALAMRELARLDQPFTTSQARQAWGTTRRVAIPLLEHLDARGWTVREDGTHRRIKR